MTTHQFTIIVNGPDLQEEAHVQALFETGCDDAAVGRMGTLQYLDFDREAEAFAEAVLSAMTAIETAEPVSFISSPMTW